MATFTELQGSDIAAIAERFGIGPVHAWSPMAAGTVNSNFAIKAQAGQFFLRVNEGKQPDDVRYEGELVAALSARGVPTPLPRRTPDGQTFLIHGPHLVSLFPWVSGRHARPPDVTCAQVYALGCALARMHAAGLSLGPGFEREGIYTFAHISARASSIEERVRERPDPVLAPALAAIRSEIAFLEERAALRAAATTGIIHGDLFPDNVFFQDDTLVALIDFEQASVGSLVYDLAVCLNAWCFDRDFDPALIRAMITGYESARRLAAAEIRALPLEARAAALRFTVTRITDVYFMGQDKPDKDFGHYLVRLERWRAIDPADLLAWGQLVE